MMHVSILSGIVAFVLWCVTDTSLKPDHVRSPKGKLTFGGIVSMVLVQIVLWTLVGLFAVWIVPRLPHFFLTGWRFPVTVFASSIAQWFALLMILQYMWLVLRATILTAVYTRKLYGEEKGAPPAVREIVSEEMQIMPVECIGEFGTPGASIEWLSAEAKLAIRYITKICGGPPPEMRIELVWQEHELGNYPIIGLVWEDAMRGTPWNYISRCEAALTAYENGGELPPGWSMPPVRSDDADDFEDAPFDPERPPEPPDTLDLFENQRFISKLIEWGFESSKHEGSKPRLVKSDDNGEHES